LRTVKLHPYIFDHIVENVDEATQLIFNSSGLVTQVKSNVLWMKYASRIYRTLNTDGPSSLFAPISEKAFKVFWSLPLLLHVRSHWYRVISKKLPTAKYLQKIGTVSNITCRLCNSPEDSLDHFIVQCPKKNFIWTTILSYHYPTFSFTNIDILNALYSIQSPFHYRSNLYLPFFVIVSTTQFYIWNAFWQLIIKDTPFLTESIINTINRQVHILL
ncbi:hypothetical protein BD770DRAFT_301741, partial [Pilaira anomala]